MATTNSLIINSVDQASKKNQKTLTSINPDANTAALKTFATKLNAITTNSLGSIAKVTREEFDPSITYHDIVWDLTPDGSGVAADTSTNTVTVTISQLSTDATQVASIEFTARAGSKVTDPFIPHLQVANTIRVQFYVKDFSAGNDLSVPMFMNFSQAIPGVCANNLREVDVALNIGWRDADLFVSARCNTGRGSDSVVAGDRDITSRYDGYKVIRKKNKVPSDLEGTCLYKNL